MPQTKWLAAAAAVVLAAAPARAGQPMDPADVAALRWVSDPRISPDGERIVYVVSSPREGERPGADLWMVPADGGPAQRFTTAPEPDRHPRWSPDGRTLAFLSSRPDAEAKFQVHLIPANGGEARRLTREPESVNAFAWSPAGDRIAYTVLEPRSPERARRREQDKHDQHDSAHRRQRRLKIIPVTGGAPATVSPPGKSVFDFAWSPDASKLAVFLAADTSAGEGYWNASLVELEPATGETRVLLRGSRSSRLAYAPDGASIAILGPPGERYSRPSPAIVDVSEATVRLLDPEHAGTPWDFVFTPDGRALLLWGHQSTEGFVGRVPVGGGRIETWFHAPMRAWGSPALSISQDGRWLAYLAEDPTHPAEVYLTSTAGRKRHGRRLSFTNPQLEQRALGRVEPVHWQSRDGLRIDGVVVHPVEDDPGTSGQRAAAPTVVMVHGGPQWQWWRGWLGGWHEPAQLLAGRGYRVLLPNPRGSTGRGHGFAAAAYADWGGEDLADILAGVDMLIDAGQADPSRLALVGWSYGGFMTAWIITRTDRFKVAVAGAAVTDLLSFHGTCDIPLFLPEQFGVSPYREPHRFLERSPVFWAHQVSTPTLIVHGEQDRRVPVGQAHELYQALREAGVTTRLITFPREGHHFHEPGHQQALLEEILAWLAAHID